MLRNVGPVLVREARHELGKGGVEIGGLGGVRHKAGYLPEVAKPLLERVGAVGRRDREGFPEELQVSEVAGEDGLAAVHVVADVSLDEDEHCDAVAVGLLVELVAKRLVEDEDV